MVSLVGYLGFLNRVTLACNPAKVYHCLQNKNTFCRYCRVCTVVKYCCSFVAVPFSCWTGETIYAQWFELFHALMCIFPPFFHTLLCTDTNFLKWIQMTHMYNNWWPKFKVKEQLCDIFHFWKCHQTNLPIGTCFQDFTNTKIFSQNFAELFKDLFMSLDSVGRDSKTPEQKMSCNCPFNGTSRKGAFLPHLYGYSSIIFVAVFLSCTPATYIN